MTCPIMIKKIQKKLASQKLDALLVSAPGNVQYLSHFTGSNKTLFITKNKCYLLTDSRYHVRAKKEIPKSLKIEIIEIKNKETTFQKITKRTDIIGFEAKDVTVSRLKSYKKLLKGKKLQATENIVENIRITKQEFEIKRIKKSCEILGKVFRNLKKEIRPGIREQDLAWKVRELAYREGAEDIAFEPIIAFGKNSALPHHKSDDTRLKNNDLILIDIGVKYQGYCSDMTRVILPKNPSEKIMKMYQACLEAKEASAQAIEPGIKAEKIDSIARKILKKYGFDRYFTHSLGHGVGINVHEKPNLSPVSKDVLRENSVFTIEPGIYIENLGGIRLEDTYVLKNGRAVSLS